MQAMPLDPQTKALLDQVAAAGGPPLDSLTPEQARTMFAAMRELAGPPEPVSGVVDRTVPGPAGAIRVRMYTPAGTGPFPALVYFHGGGWVIGSLDSLDSPCRSLANAAGCAVISVDYRLAPEHKFPAAAEDCYAATYYVVQNAAALNVDPGRIAVGGDSAGGNLAAVVTLMARDRGGPALAFQLLVYPVTNHDYETASYQDNAEGYLLTKSLMVWFWNHYLRDETDGRNSYASPLRAESLGGLPPALVVTAGYDPLRDEGEAYAARLREAGVRAETRRCDDTIHGFFQLAGVLDLGRQMVADAGAALREALTRQSAPAT
jgi:acetyl esterase